MKLKSLLTTFAAVVGITTAAVAKQDENGITPYTWYEFDTLEAGAISSSTTIPNSGSCTGGWSVTDGTVVENDGTGKAWQIASSSYYPGTSKNGASVKPTTYIVRVNFNGQTFSGDKVIWSCNGKAYNGLCLTVRGNPTNGYTVDLCKHTGSKSTVAYSYSVPTEKVSGYHWYAVTTSGQAMAGTSVLYVDGVAVGTSSGSGNWYSGQNTYFSFGKYGNGNDAVATGLIYDDIRMYDQVLTDVQIATIAGVSGTTYKATISGATTWGDIEWDPAIEGEPEPLDVFEVTSEGTDTVLTFDNEVSYSCKLSLKGDAITVKADDSLYEDGCWIKEFAKFGALTCEAEPTFADIMDGYKGAYTKTSTGFTLRAQNCEVISINFANGQSVSGTGYTGLAPVQGNTWINMTTTWGSGGKTVDLGTIKATADGETTEDVTGATGSCYAANTYGWNSATDVFLKGYLDDGGNKAQVTVTGIPYASYDVIVYCATDNAGKSFRAVTVNGTAYTYDSENPAEAKEGADNWGTSQTTTAVYGTNAIRIRNQSLSQLTIVGGSNGDGARGCIAAVQIISTGEIVFKSTYTATISESTAFEDISWDEGEFEEGQLNEATITVDDSSEGEVEITFGNPEMSLAKLDIISARDIKLTADSALSNVAQLLTTGCTAKVTYAYPVSALATSDKDVAYAGGTAGDTAIGISHGGAGTTLNLIGGTYKLSETHGDSETTVNVTDSTLNYPDTFGEGKGAYVIGGSSTLNATRFILVQGSGNNCTFTLKDTAAVNVSSSTIEDTNKNGVMFGHWKGNSTFTIQDDATFTAANTQILVGKTAGNHTINVNGGTITTKGIKAAGYASGTNILNLNGGSLVLGEIGIAAYANTINVNVNSNSTITASAATTITQPMTIAADTTLTLDAKGFAMTVSADISGSGNITVVDSSEGAAGGVAFTGDMSGFTGRITYESGAYGLGTARTLTVPEYITLGKDVKFIATQTVAEYAQGIASEFTGFTEGQQITLSKLDGTSETLTVDAEGKAASEASGEVHIDGMATYADATFTNATSVSRDYGYHGTLSYRSNASIGLQYDSAVTTNATGTGAYLKHHPWLEGGLGDFLGSSEITIAVVGEMSVSNNTTFVHIGNSNSGLTGVLLATGAKEDEVVVKVNTGTTLEEVTTMTVPHAATARHVYIITKTDTETESIFSVYLDGTPWKTVHLSKKTFSGGVQCGSDFGGQLRNGKIVNAVSSDDTALINVLRIYDRVISAAEIAAYSVAYPYVSESGTSSRTFTEASEDWIGAEEATCWSFKQTATSEAVLTNAPVGASSIEIKGTADVTTTVTVNLAADEHSDAVKISSPGAFKFVKGEVDAQLISGQTTIGCPVEIEYGSLDISGAPLTLIDEGAVTFDLSGVDFSTYYSSATILLTGDTEETTAITAKGLPESTAARTIAFGYNGTQYVVTITVDSEIPFVYNEGWKWGETDVDEATVSNNTALAIIVQSDLAWNIDRDTITVSNGTLTVTAVTKRAAEVTVEAGAVLDVNGYQVKEMALTLNGGKVTNSGANPGEADQIKTLTLTADSEIDTPVKGQVYAASYATATTIALDEYTLTKTGKDQLQVVNVDITGSGTIYVKEGEFYGSEDTRAAGVTFKVGADGTLHNRSTKTMTLAKIIGEGGTLNNEGTMPGFELEGTLTIKNAGEFGTITNASGAVVTIGTKRGLTFAGAGTVNVTLTDAEIAAGTPITLFATNGVTTTAIGTITYNGADITDKCKVEGNQITELPPFKAKIGTTFYLTLQAAFTAAGEEYAEVVLVADTAETHVTVKADQYFKLYLNNHTLTADGQGVDNYGRLFIFGGNADNTDGTGAIVAREGAINVYSTSATFIKSGIFTSTDNAVVMGNGSEGQGIEVLSIEGGTFNSSIKTAGYIACGVYIPNASVEEYYISGATFNITNGCGVCARAGTTYIDEGVVFNLVNDGEVKGWVGDKKSQVPGVQVYFDWTESPYPGYEEGDTIYSAVNTFTISSDQEWSAEPDEYGYYKLQKKVEPQGTVLLITDSGATTNRYETIAAAIDAATDGDTVMLTEDMTLDATLALNKAITLDLGEKEITLATAGDGIKVTANATVKNGTLTSQLTANTAVYALHSYKTSATYEDLVINGAYYRFVVYAEGADTIPACYGENDPTTTVTCNNVDVTGNGTLFEAEFTMMNLDANCSGIVEGTPWNYAAAIYSAGNATITIAGGAYTNTLALLSGNLGGSIIVNGGAFGGDIKSWMESDKHTEYHSDPKFKANFMFNAGTYNGAIVFEDSSDAARELDSFSKLLKVAIAAPEGYEWKNFAATQYYHLTKKSDTPSIPESQGAITPVEGKENTYAVSNTTDTVDISNLPTGATIILDPSVTYLSGMAQDTTVKIVAESTNTTENVVDITGAFKVLSGTGTTATISLDKDGEVTIDGENIPVTPEVTTASEGTIAEGAVATKAIPGLTYTLVRDSDVGGTYTTTADSETAKGTTVTLKDKTVTKPTDKAFYKIQVTK